MTKHIPDESETKLPLSLDNANTILTEKVNLDSSEDISLCCLCLKSLREVSTNSKLDQSADTVTTEPLKGKLEKHMSKLYDLEPDIGREKPLNIEFAVNLYQMECF